MQLSVNFREIQLYLSTLAKSCSIPVKVFLRMVRLSRQDEQHVVLKMLVSITLKLEIVEYGSLLLRPTSTSIRLVLKLIPESIVNSILQYQHIQMDDGGITVRIPDLLRQELGGLEGRLEGFKLSPEGICLGLQIS